MKVDLKSLLYNCLVPLMLSFIVMMLLPYEVSYYNLLPIKLPMFIFILIYSIMYVLMGLSGYYTENSEELTPIVLKLYYMQLILNLLFMPLFFYLKNPLISIILLLLLLVITLIYSYKVKKIKKVGFYIIIPYLIWLLFIMYLLFGMHFLNK